jgi:hypothetical protein
LIVCTMYYVQTITSIVNTSFNRLSLPYIICIVKITSNNFHLSNTLYSFSSFRKWGMNWMYENIKFKILVLHSRQVYVVFFTTKTGRGLHLNKSCKASNINCTSTTVYLYTYDMPNSIIEEHYVRYSCTRKVPNASI